jgi:uncharacterized protein
MRRLTECSPELEHALTHGTRLEDPFCASEIRRETVWVTMRDGIRLATDIYFPPISQAPAVALRTPYGRSHGKIVGVCYSFARNGYIVISQDCRGTGASEPEDWDYYMYESEDGYDLVDWIAAQGWFDGFLGGCGGSYVGQTQWCMATHPAMTTIVPEVSGLGVAGNSAHLYMFLNSYARSVGRGAGKVAASYTDLEKLMLPETLAGGYFNEPLHPRFSDGLHAQFPILRDLPPEHAKLWLWRQYCSLSSADRAMFVKTALGVNSVSMAEVEALPAIFGQGIAHDAHSLPHASPAALCESLYAIPLMVTGWYDWALNDALATWLVFRRAGQQSVRMQARLIISPGAHNAPGYHEGAETHPELRRAHRLENNVPLLLRWYSAVREKRSDSWPTVIYYLMGANEWQVASDWPPPDASKLALHLSPEGGLMASVPKTQSASDSFTYDPEDPTPTVGGSILSSVYPQGSVDVREVQERTDVLTYTTDPLECALDVVGPVRMILYASSSAVDTDFSARISDVFPDGRAIQIQRGILRARYRNDAPELLQPHCIYRLEIDMWATANRFKPGHRLRLDISSADFPRFDRNANLGGDRAPPVRAEQTIYRCADYPSHLILSVLEAVPQRA